jgi:hypothetical protein
VSLSVEISNVSGTGEIVKSMDRMHQDVSRWIRSFQLVGSGHHSLMSRSLKPMVKMHQHVPLIGSRQLRRKLYRRPLLMQ